MWILLELLGIIFLVSAAYAGIRAAPWWPTPRVDLERAFRLANIQFQHTVYDLGCGDGRFLSFVARRGMGKALFGYEISLLFYLLARVRLHTHKQARIFLRDFWHVDLSQADVVYVFLTTRIYPRLRQKLEAELKPGALIICYVWPMEGWTPIKTDVHLARNIYLYQR